ncbi:hypothetical protein WMF45_49350 [Sorangium sp. So ce448]|uniref:hypothetical protein n=1 Tax=Sorangium sp. So ce448 TaxID=3133314 RepID=UPI003F5F78BF
MHHSRFTALTLAVMGSLGALCISRPSSACTPVPDGRYVYDASRAMPLDGVIVVRLSCYSNCPESAPVLLVTDKITGEAVSGTLEEVAEIAEVVAGQRESVLAFRPAAPLVEGHTYQIALEGEQRGTVPWETRASAAVDMDVGAIPVETWVAVQERWRGEASCCVADLGSASCGPLEACVAEEVEHYVTVSLDLTGEEDSGVRQYVQIVTFSSPDGKELDTQTFWDGNPSHTYDVAATEYCYQITYKSLIDGTTVETERACVPHGDAGATGVFPADPAQIAANIGACSSPPQGFEEAWCSARAAFCEEAPHLCADNDVSSCEAPDTGAGGSGGSGAGGGSDAPEDPDGDHVSVGCSVGAGSGASSGWALPAIGLALSLASRARRRRDRR